MASWTAFWERPNAIYVGRAHLEAHYRRLGADLVGLVGARRDLRVLDFGCGEALAAEAFVAAGWRVALYDAARETTARLAARHGGSDRIEVLDAAAYAALPPGRFDAILAVSVVQYVPPEALREMLARWRALLTPGGRLLVADVIAPKTNALEDARALLRFAAANGFLGAAVLGLARALASDYSRLRRTLGLARYDADAFLALFADAGFAAERLPANPGPSPHRLAFLARATP